MRSLFRLATSESLPPSPSSPLSLSISTLGYRMLFLSIQQQDDTASDWGGGGAVHLSVTGAFVRDGHGVICLSQGSDSHASASSRKNSGDDTKTSLLCRKNRKIHSAASRP